MRPTDPCSEPEGRHCAKHCDGLRRIRVLDERTRFEGACRYRQVQLGCRLPCYGQFELLADETRVTALAAPNEVSQETIDPIIEARESLMSLFERAAVERLIEIACSRAGQCRETAEQA